MLITSPPKFSVPAFSRTRIDEAIAPRFAFSCSISPAWIATVSMPRPNSAVRTPVWALTETLFVSPPMKKFVRRASAPATCTLRFVALPPIRNRPIAPVATWPNPPT